MSVSERSHTWSPDSCRGHWSFQVKLKGVEVKRQRHEGTSNADLRKWMGTMESLGERRNYSLPILPRKPVSTRRRQLGFGFAVSGLLGTVEGARILPFGLRISFRELAQDPS